MWSLCVKNIWVQAYLAVCVHFVVVGKVYKAATGYNSKREFKSIAIAGDTITNNT
jgi:hypothetical protein